MSWTAVTYPFNLSLFYWAVIIVIMFVFFPQDSIHLPRILILIIKTVITAVIFKKYKWAVILILTFVILTENTDSTQRILFFETTSRK
jgi:hypothetical protein